MQKRRKMLATLLGGLGLSKAASAASADNAGPKNAWAPGLLFIQQDNVLSFPPTGDGVRVGTATGRLAGSTITNFQFLPVPPPEFQADDLVVITDSEGDQILFRARVTGRFLAPFGEASLPNGNVFGLGGPFSGTYEVTKATGKYGYLVGRKFPCKGIGSNPAKGNFLGTVYVEVYLDRFDDRPI
ncbi:MAG: hypothetical protein WD696_01785 [Bryobacteraceae bacterium]